MNADDFKALLAGGYPYLWVATHEEDRARSLLARAARDLQRDFGSWSRTGGLVLAEAGASIDDDTTRLTVAMAQIQRLRKAVICLVDLHRHIEDPHLIRTMRDLIPHLEAREVTVAAITPTGMPPAELERDTVLVDLPLPGTELIEEGLCEVLPASDPRLPALARAAQGLTLGESRRALRRALFSAGLDPDPEALIRMMAEEKRRLVRRSEVLEFVQPEDGLEAVGGLAALKDWLQTRRRTLSEEARGFGLPAPKGLFLLGVQGCGKSLTAKVVARELNLPLLRLDLGAVFSRASAGPEENLRAAMRLSEAMAPVVLWIDEIEKGFAGVSGDGDPEGGGGAGDPSGARAFGSFLTWLQEKQKTVFVIATANDVTALPPELLRKGRFDEIFFIDLPDKAERAEVLAIHLKRRGREPGGFPLAELAKLAEHFSGAELEQAVVGGLYRAFAAARELEADDLAAEIKSTVPMYATYEERVKSLREWARNRARRASVDMSLANLFTRQS